MAAGVESFDGCVTGVTVASLFVLSSRPGAKLITIRLAVIIVIVVIINKIARFVLLIFLIMMPPSS